MTGDVLRRLNVVTGGAVCGTFRLMLKNLAVFLFLFVILPVIIWGLLFYLYTDPLIRVLLLTFVLGYYLFMLFVCYRFLPDVWGLIRRTFYGVGADDFERRIAENYAPGYPARDSAGHGIDANIIVGRGGCRIEEHLKIKEYRAREIERKRQYSHTQSFCAQCGRPNKIDAKQCAVCATPLDPTRPLPPPPPD